MTIAALLKTLRKALCLVLSASLVATGTLPAIANAQSFTCDSYAADRGADARCTAVRMNGIPMAAPKLQWTRLSDMPVQPLHGTETVSLAGRQELLMADKAALLLNVKSSEIASMVSAFPSNVPYVFARYNVLDNTMRIDIFKLEKVSSGGTMRAGLYHAVWGPAMGDAWKLNRSYISPDAFKAGAAGVNPFNSFKVPGSDDFANITLEGAQVAVGHAMRMVGAPLGLFSTSFNRFSQETTKSGGLFTKKTTVTTYGNVKPRWFIAQPLQFLQRSTTATEAAFCAGDPTTQSCPRYATATSGIGFEEFDGGTLSALEDKWQVDQQSKTGLSFLGALVLAVVGSFAIVGLMGLAGIGAAATASTASAAGVSVGSMGALVSSVTGLTFTSTLSAIAVETALTAASMAIVGGANLGSTINLDVGVLLGFVTVSKGLQVAQNLTALQSKLNAQLAPRLVRGDLTQSPGATLSGIDRTVTGGCSPGLTTTACGASSGMITRVDEYLERNEGQFVRDNSGSILRIDKPAYAGF